MGDFKRLDAWHRAHILAVEIYRATRTLPKPEEYGLKTQMRRAAGSVSANIAEGCGRLGDREMARFLRYARGSATELESHLRLAQDTGLLPAEVTEALIAQSEALQRMLFRLIGRLAKRMPNPTHDLSP